MEAWREWLRSEAIRFHEARKSDAQRFTSWLEREPHDAGHGRMIHYKPSTVLQRVAGCSAFYGYLADENLVSSNPFRKVRKPQASKTSTTRGLDEKQAAALADAAEVTGHLEAAVVWVMLATGMRVSELCGIELDDVEELADGYMLSIRRKGGRIDQTKVPGRAAVILRTWLDARPVDWYSQRVFARDGVGLQRSQVSYMLARLTEAAGLQSISPHGLRHTAATLLLNADVSVWTVQTHLGHRSIESTLRYDRARLTRAATAAVALVDILTNQNGAAPSMMD